jgi:hypothetical protein
MADEFDENFLIENKYMRSAESVKINQDELINDEQDDVFNMHHQNEMNSQSVKKRNKKKNITDILKIKQDELNKSAYCKTELKAYLNDYIDKNLSIIEKNEFDLDSDALSKLIRSLDSNSKTKRGNNKLASLFNDKFKPKFENYKAKMVDRKGSKFNKPYMIVLCSSAQRCIELQKDLNSFTANNIRWFYSFAKHKKLNEQVNYLNSNEINLIYATPSRLIQLLEAKCIKLNLLKALVIDYKHRDVKLKRFFDLNEIKKEFFNLYFNFFRKYCKKIKLYII